MAAVRSRSRNFTVRLHATHGFGVVPWRGESVRPPVTGVAVVDQVCLDIPDHLYDAEARFWAALTGRSWQPTNDPVFAFLTLPGSPVRLLMQRIDDGPPGMHGMAPEGSENVTGLSVE